MNRKRKIAIVGAGNAACITAMNQYFHGRDCIDKIKIYYDPESPIERVGQGATILISKLLYDVFDLNWFNQLKLIGATRKDGILYENWGKVNDKIFHDFPLHTISLHYVPQMLSKMVLNSGLFEVIEKKIDDPEEEIDSDFIFDCRGRHNRDSELYEELTNPLNSVILARKDEPDPTLTYTKCVATPDGWTFVIPNIDGVSYGYLFNKNITDKETAEKNMKNLFGVEPDGHLVFENYLAKKFFHGNRTILNGNRLSFLEPLEATSTSFYENVSNISLLHIRHGMDINFCNEIVRHDMKKIETFILWHYRNGSKYDTPFWDYAKSLPFKGDDQFNDMISYCNNKSLIDIKRDPEQPAYSQWSAHSFKRWIDANNLSSSSNIND